MSTLKVNKLRDTAGSADAITLDPNGGAVLAGVTTVTSVKVGAAVTISESGIEASGIGITCANINGGQIGGRRNIIINGDCRVAQRGTSSTTGGLTTIDRWRGAVGSGLGSITFTGSQQSLSSSDTGPWGEGFRKYFRIAQSGAGTANAAGALENQYRIEAQDIANSGWNYLSPSSFMTISFWFRCSTNQTFYGRIYSYDGTAQAYAYSFTASANNTWTKITHTFPGNANLTFDDDANAGMQLLFIPFYGTDYTNDKTLNTWAAHSSSNYVPDMASTWLTAGASTFDMTGLQLEVGSQATAFEHCSFGEELSLCRRYYYRETINNTEYFNGLGKADSDGNSIDLNLRFPVRMRTTPSAVEQTGDGNNYLIRGSSTLQCTGVPTYGDATQESATVRFTRSSHSISTNNVANCGSWGGSYLGFSAEL